MHPYVSSDHRTGIQQQDVVTETAEVGSTAVKSYLATNATKVCGSRQAALRSIISSSSANSAVPVVLVACAIQVLTNEVYRNVVLQRRRHKQGRQMTGRTNCEKTIKTINYVSLSGGCSEVLYRSDATYTHQRRVVGVQR